LVSYNKDIGHNKHTSHVNKIVNSCVLLFDKFIQVKGAKPKRHTVYLIIYLK